jgi:hypothetical protein
MLKNHNYENTEKRQVGYRLENITVEKIERISEFYKCTAAELIEHLVESSIEGENYFVKNGDYEEIKKLMKRFDSSEREVDMVIVPSQPKTFNDMFLNSYWSCITLSPRMATNGKLKYLACYEASPISAVRFYAEIEDIKPNQEQRLKYDIFLKETIYRFNAPVTLFEPSTGLRHFMYTSLNDMNNKAMSIKGGGKE